MTPQFIQGSQTTSSKVVIPFYLYAAVAFLTACILLFFSADSFRGHYFHPRLLAITHLMALGWGTMIILGASHQLVPVLTENKLYSKKLALASFILAAIGIPLLVNAFYEFRMGNPAKWGGRFILLSLLCYLVNVAKSIAAGKSTNVHATFIMTSVVWLFLTTLYGLALVYDFTTEIFPENTVHYLPLHAHTGIIGWFLMLIIGVGSRLLPMFLISKYKNERILWWIYYLINTSLVLFIVLFHVLNIHAATVIPMILLLAAIALFVVYCRKVVLQRIRKKVDDQMKMSLGSVGLVAVLAILLAGIVVATVIWGKPAYSLVIAYGFVIFFGWITAIILGMTFKTMPFIVWNSLYKRYGANELPSPKDLFKTWVFKLMMYSYVLGFTVFLSGIFLDLNALLHTGAILLIVTAFMYCFNVFEMIMYKVEPND